MDTTRISELFNIVEKSAAHSGRLNGIMNAAMAELLKINADIKAGSQPSPEVIEPELPITPRRI